MDPNQQPQYPSTNPGSPYEFILSPSGPPRRRLSFGGNNFLMTIGLLVGGAVVLILLIIGVSSLFSSGSGSSTNDLISLAQTENELVRVSTEATTNAVQQTTQNLAVTIEFVMTSQQQGVLRVLKTDNTKPSTKILGLKEDTSTDSQLSEALENGTYDQTYMQIMQNELEGYASALAQLNKLTSSKTEQQLTYNDYQQTELILKEIQQNLS